MKDVYHKGTEFTKVFILTEHDTFDPVSENRDVEIEQQT
jgi:hypothetical protein